jgi:hypothetical protein
VRCLLNPEFNQTTMQLAASKSMSNNAIELDDLLPTLMQLQRFLSMLDLRIDNWICKLGKSNKNGMPSPVPNPQQLTPKPSAPRPPAVGSQNLAPLSSLASAGAVETWSLAGGALMVQIDGRKKFRLTRAPAALLDELRAAAGASTDLAGWKTIAELQVALGKRLGGGVSRHAVRKLVWRLRRELFRHKEDRRLIQNDRKLGYRLVLRHGGDL